MLNRYRAREGAGRNKSTLIPSELTTDLIEKAIEMAGQSYDHSEPGVVIAAHIIEVEV